MPYVKVLVSCATYFNLCFYACVCFFLFLVVQVGTIFFRSVISYRTSSQPLFSQDIVASSPKLSLYDSIDEEVITSYNEFTLTSLIFYALKENATSEQSSRMTAMENATKNAGKMITFCKLFD